MPVQGIRLFRVLGITVFLHWSWLLGAAYFLSSGGEQYTSPAYHVAEVLGLFAIVLLHEFGHALACRSVGGRADRIVLWPLGGVAYVSPPPRPGAVLWSIAAGPLVNVALLFAFAPCLHVRWTGGGWPQFWAAYAGNVGQLVATLGMINLGLLVFNLMPVYPLDGGQILQSLLWFGLGRARSLAVSTVVGGVGAVGLGLWALRDQSMWLGLIAFFVASRCWAGWKHAGELRRSGGGDPYRQQTAPFPVVFPRRPDVRCPSCGQHPPRGGHWGCPACRTRLDKFEYPYACPACGHADDAIGCPDCRSVTPYADWRGPPSAVINLDPPLVQGEWVDG